MRTRREWPLQVMLLLALALPACGSTEKDEPTGDGAGGAATGAGGTTDFPGGAPGAGGAPCGDIGASCTTSGECCDPAAYCNQTDQVAERRGCQKRCATGTECATGCCLAFQGQAFGICTDAKWCACGAEGTRCGGSEPECCDDQGCVGGDPQGTFFECRPKCTTAADCATGCCVDIVVGLRACLDPVYCGG